MCFCFPVLKDPEKPAVRVSGALLVISRMIVPNIVPLSTIILAG
jgi:hypothetical protein